MRRLHVTLLVLVLVAFLAVVGFCAPPVPAYQVIVSAEYSGPIAGTVNVITLEVQTDKGQTDGKFDGTKTVTVSGYEVAPDGTSYGTFGGTALETDGSTNVDGITFIDGMGGADLVLYNASEQVITFSVEGVANPGTETITPTPDSAAALKVQQQPVGSESAGGGALATQPIVQVVDAYENVVTGSSASVTAAEKVGSGSWALGGTMAVNAFSGLVSFTDLTATTTEFTDVTTAALTFTSGILTAVDSDTFTVKAAIPAGPTCDTITPTTSTPTNSTTVSFTVVFSEDVQNFDAEADLVIAETGTVAHTGVLIGGGPRSYTVDVTGVTGDGDMTLAVNTGSDVQDLAANALTSSVTSSAVTIDNDAPGLSSFERGTPASEDTNADTLVFRATFDEAVTAVVFRATFDEAVTAVDTADFAVNGTTTATVSGVDTADAGAGLLWDVTVSGGDLAGFSGVVGLDLAGGQDITDLVGNALPGGEPGTDETYTLDNDP